MSCRFDHAGFCHCIEANERDRTNIPSDKRCARCPNYNGGIRGAGDAIAAVTHAIGIDPCGTCQERREALNKMIPNPFKQS